ncbi:MAG: hypothetical protein ABR926_02700 [Streptosporangiaceae bacterium]|jgi:hypothetical protein
MITTQDRLRAAMQAAAGTVPPASAPPLRLPAEPGRPRAGRRWLRAMTPLAAAAAVAGVVIASLALTRGVTSSSGPAESAAQPVALHGVPAFYVALSNAATPAQAVIRATATGAVVATVKPPRPYGTFKFVTGAADDHTFVLAAQRWWPIASGTRGLAAEKRDNTTPVAFFRLRFDPATGTARLTALHIARKIPASSLDGIAVSPDSSRLALALYPAQIEVITLATGSARQWTWPGAAPSTGPWVGNSKPSGQPLSWTANGRTLAFPLTTESGGITWVMLLNLSSPGSSLQSAARRGVSFLGLGHIKPGPVGNALITPDGTRITTITMQLEPSQARVTEFSARTGQPVSPPPPGTTPGTLTPWSVLWADSSGSTLIVNGIRTGPSAATVTGILRRGRFTPLPGAPLATDNVAW